MRLSPSLSLGSEERKETHLLSKHGPKRDLCNVDLLHHTIVVLLCCGRTPPTVKKQWLCPSPQESSSLQCVYIGHSALLLFAAVPPSFIVLFCMSTTPCLLLLLLWGGRMNGGDSLCSQREGPDTLESTPRHADGEREEMAQSLVLDSR